MVLNQESTPTSHYQETQSTSSCRFNNPFQGFSSFPTPYMPQLTDLSQPIDFSQSGHDRYQPRPVEDWLSNVYYQNTTATLPHSMYHYRYNPYQMYDYSSYAQNFHHQYTTPHQPQPLTMTHTSPAASISPISSVGSSSPQDQHHPTVNFDWMKPTSSFGSRAPGKTRTKDKYRVVYSDFQRLELEKEFCYNKFISIRRKSEIATMLNLSDRQVKIWFQNRRAKERRQKKEFDTITTTPLVTDTTEDCQNTFLEQSSIPSSSSPVEKFSQSATTASDSSFLLTSSFPWKDTNSSDSDSSPSFIL
ncbi:homeobox protein CDX-2-like [Mytilus edulis]|uniref:homeobox protein CDX-2-like n=1 Tax=Mytilus edulis TaxID=6550 RepID=UPI0039F06B70